MLNTGMLTNAVVDPGHEKRYRCSRHCGPEVFSSRSTVSLRCSFAQLPDDDRPSDEYIHLLVHFDTTYDINTYKERPMTDLTLMAFSLISVVVEDLHI